MSAEHPHSKLIAAAARDVLKPIGLARKGRSRTWLDDQGWWLGVVEFQPSSYSRGTYLNVGLSWLWSGKNYPAFNFGGRVHVAEDGRDTQFWDFESEDQFQTVAHHVVSVAKDRIEQLRRQFPDPTTAATTLAAKPTPAQRLDRAVLLAVQGDNARALAEIRQFVDILGPLKPDGQQRWLDRADALRERVTDPPRFHEWITSEIRQTRSALKLDPSHELPEAFRP